MSYYIGVWYKDFVYKKSDIEKMEAEKYNA